MLYVKRILKTFKKDYSKLNKADCLAYDKFMKKYQIEDETLELVYLVMKRKYNELTGKKL